jgi:putative ABC transport system permease protein
MIGVELKESFRMAMVAVAAHKLRSALTLLGIVIGVFSIIVVMTAMRVMQGTVEDSLSEFGANTFVVQKWPGIQFGGPESFEKYRRRKRITMEQGMILRERATLPLNIGMETDLTAAGIASSRYDRTNPDCDLRAGSPETFPAKNLSIAEGRALNASDEENARNLCVAAAALAKKLFPHSSALGEQVKFDGVNYTVVGVLASKGEMSGGDEDNYLVIPVSTGLNRYGKERGVSLLVQARDQSVYNDTMEQVRGIMRALRKVPPGADDDFEMFSNDSLIAQFRTITLAVRIGVAVISSIALITAGIGIMNIMLVSVTERTREIGVRRAIGAKKRNIMTQFISEAVVLCQVGGVIGVGLGILGGNGAALWLKAPPIIPYDWAVIGLVICSIVGIVFGTYPAYKAANLDPIESLRYE